MDGDEDDVRPELVTFTCKGAYVYKAPPSTVHGHRAELWGVDNPMQEVACSVVTSGDDCCVRLADKESGELFAECPIVKEKPLTASVEAVIDSSRYFVLRVADHGDSRRHAFLGFGFRERSHATDFIAALSDHIGYLRRQKEARQMQESFQAAQAGQQGPNLPTLNFSLKPGETVSLKLADKAPVPRSSFMSKRLAAMTIYKPSHSGALLPPPPAASQLEPRSLSGPLQEGGSSSPKVTASHEKPTSETAQQQEMCQQDSLACVDTIVPSNVHQQQQPVQQASSTSDQHAARKQAPADQSEEEDDDQFGTFVTAQ